MFNALWSNEATVWEPRKAPVWEGVTSPLSLLPRHCIWAAAEADRSPSPELSGSGLWTEGRSLASILQSMFLPAIAWSSPSPWSCSEDPSPLWHPLWVSPSIWLWDHLLLVCLPPQLRPWSSFPLWLVAPPPPSSLSCLRCAPSEAAVSPACHIAWPPQAPLKCPGRSLVNPPSRAALPQPEGFCSHFPGVCLALHLPLSLSASCPPDHPKRLCYASSLVLFLDFMWSK